MKRYVIRKGPRPRAWQVIAADKARWITSIEASDAEIERLYNRMAVVTVQTRSAAERFITKIGGILE